MLGFTNNERQHNLGESRRKRGRSRMISADLLSTIVFGIIAISIVILHGYFYIYKKEDVKGRKNDE